jgi:peptide/nickel transport system substrate-binding protein/oligopeptide transport system substrate-binding protein
MLRSTAALLIALAVMLAGCMPGKRSGEGPPAQPMVPAVHGGTVRLPIEAAPTDPALKTLDFSDPRLFALARCLEVPLVRASPQGELLPGLASSSQCSPDGVTWSFMMRKAPGHEAEPTYFAQGLASSWQVILRGSNGPLAAQLGDMLTGAREFASGKAGSIAGITVTGSTLELKLTRANRILPLWLSQPGLGLLDKREAPTAGFAPFLLASSANGELVLKPNPAALDGPPLLDELRFICVPDRGRQLALFLEGKLDAANLDVDAVQTARADPALAPALVDHQTAAVVTALFNQSHFPWGDSKFQSKLGLRQALNWALDREYLGTALEGQITPWTHILPPPFRSFLDPASLAKPLYPLAPEIELARQGEIDADHEQGSHLIPGMDLGYLRTAHLEAAAVLILHDWKAISIDMRPFPLTEAELELRVRKKSHEILLKRACPAYPDPDAFFYPVFRSTLAGTGGNWSYLSDDSIDKMLTDAEAQADSIARQELYRKLGLEVEMQSLCVLLGYASPTMLISPELAGLSLTPYDFDASLPAQDFTKLGRKAEPER